MNIQKARIYLNAFINKLNNFDPKKDDTKTHTQRAVFYGISYVVEVGEEATTYNQAIKDFKFYSLISELVGTLTPNDFLEIFPIKKGFDGKKWQRKDYFYTKDYLSRFDMNKPIGENAIEFLWEFQNDTVTDYVVTTMVTMNQIRRFEGKTTLTEEACNIFGFKAITVYKDNLGNQFMIDESGKTSKLSEKKRLPSYLKVIK